MPLMHSENILDHKLGMPFFKKFTKFFPIKPLQPSMPIIKSLFIVNFNNWWIRVVPSLCKHCHYGHFCNCINSMIGVRLCSSAHAFA